MKLPILILTAILVTSASPAHAERARPVIQAPTAARAADRAAVVTGATPAKGTYSPIEALAGCGLYRNDDVADVLAVVCEGGTEPRIFMVQPRQRGPK